MKIFAETERLILRELLPSDAEGMFELDSNPEVHRYLGGKPIRQIEESIQMITGVRDQYERFGIGRWAAVEKKTNQFIGWSGLKRVQETYNGHTDFYDVGYRFIQRFWGLGYASESAKVARNYAFDTLKIKILYGMADLENIASRKALEKTGLQYVNTFPWNDRECAWYELTSSDFDRLKATPNP